MSQCTKEEKCNGCGGHLRKLVSRNVNVTGTRDGFGVGNEFIDEKTGKNIDNWKDWEKAGYTDLKSQKDNDVNRIAKDKMKQLKRDGVNKKIHHETFNL